jgi:type IV pilus assembly protein PilX
MYPVRYSQHSQSGVTLIISLVLLLLLTLIAVSSMKTTGLQEKMAGNDRDRSLAFQAAEAALLAGELKIESVRVTNGTISTFCNDAPKADGTTQAATPGLFHQVLTSDNKTSPRNSYCKPCVNACPPPSPNISTTWTDNAKSILFNTGNALLAQQPRYFITYVETRPYTDESSGNRGYSASLANKSGPDTYVFIVTARGTGVQGGTEVLLQAYVGGSAGFEND